MNLTEATSKASDSSESLCEKLRELRKEANKIDPLFEFIVGQQLSKAVELKNILVQIDGAAKRRK